MKDYWELSEKERSQLDDLAPFYAVELMKAGLSEPLPPELVEVPEVTVPTLTTWHLTYRGEYSYSDPETSLGFPTKEAALKALELGAVEVERRHAIGRHVAIPAFGVAPRETAISLSDAERLSDQLSARKEAEELNQRRSDVYAKEHKRCSDALDAIREDYHRCRDLAKRMFHIGWTLDEYTKIAGDRELAKRFLMKAFEREELLEAEAWFQIDLLPTAGTELAEG